MGPSKGSINNTGPQTSARKCLANHFTASKGHRKAQRSTQQKLLLLAAHHLLSLSIGHAGSVMRRTVLKNDLTGKHSLLLSPHGRCVEVTKANTLIIPWKSFGSSSPERTCCLTSLKPMLVCWLTNPKLKRAESDSLFPLNADLLFPAAANSWMLKSNPKRRSPKLSRLAQYGRIFCAWFLCNLPELVGLLSESCRKSVGFPEFRDRFPECLRFA